MGRTGLEGSDGQWKEESNTDDNGSGQVEGCFFEKERGKIAQMTLSASQMNKMQTIPLQKDNAGIVTKKTVIKGEKKGLFSFSPPKKWAELRQIPSRELNTIRNVEQAKIGYNQLGAGKSKLSRNHLN